MFFKSDPDLLRINKISKATPPPAGHPPPPRRNPGATELEETGLIWELGPEAEPLTPPHGSGSAGGLVLPGWPSSQTSPGHSSWPG